MQNTTIAVDLAKSVVEVSVSYRPVAVAAHHRLSRSRFSRFLAGHAPATVVMEACGSTHSPGSTACDRPGWPTRTARLNTVRGLLRELGLTIPLGSRQVVPHVWGLISDADSEVPDPLRPVRAEAAHEIRELERRTTGVESQLEGIARESELVIRLRTIPGVGLLTATVLVASIGDAKRFPSGRHCASSLGITPRQASSGNTRRLGRITKRGDPICERY